MAKLQIQFSLVSNAKRLQIMSKFVDIIGNNLKRSAESSATRGAGVHWESLLVGTVLLNVLKIVSVRVDIQERQTFTTTLGLL